MGYKYIELTDDTTFKGAILPSDPLDEITLRLFPWKTHHDPLVVAGMTNAIATGLLCEYEGFDYCVFNPSNGIFEVSDDKYFNTKETKNVVLTDYTLNLDSWVDEGSTKNWLLDFNQMKCYEKGSCTVYSLTLDHANAFDPT